MNRIMIPIVLQLLDYKLLLGRGMRISPFLKKGISIHNKYSYKENDLKCVALNEWPSLGEAQQHK